MICTCLAPPPTCGATSTHPHLSIPTTTDIHKYVSWEHLTRFVHGIKWAVQKKKEQNNKNCYVLAEDGGTIGHRSYYNEQT